MQCKVACIALKMSSKRIGEGLRSPCKSDRAIRSVLFAAVCLLVFPTQLLCVDSAVETHGEVVQGLFRVLSVISVVAVLVFRFAPNFAFAAVLLVACTIIPYQVLLLNRLVQMEDAMKKIVHERTRLQVLGKEVPTEISAYEFSDHWLHRFVQSYIVDKDSGEFFVSYFIQNPGITRSYSSKTGWSYYPD